MKIQKYIKESFSVIGKEGSTHDGNGFIQKLWADANSHFSEVAELAKTDEDGRLTGLWGAMSDLSHSFMPWEDQFTKGLYLAGIEVKEDAQAPQGWAKWTIPAYEYIVVKRDHDVSFSDVLHYMSANGIGLVGAAHDFTDPQTGESFMYFPMREL